MSLNLMDAYTESSDALNLIDEKLDSRDGGTTSLKTKVLNEKIEATEENWTVVADSITSQLAQFTEEEQYGFYFGLVRKLDKTYGEKAKKFLDDLVEAMPKPEPLISEAEVAPLIEQRKQVYAQIKAVIAMAEAFGDNDAEKMTAPRRRGGAPKGKRGPRAITFINWSIDGVDFEDLKSVIEVLPQYDKQKELTDAMKAAKVDLTTPPARIEFTLPDGRTLVGVNTLAQEEDDSEDDGTTDEDE